MLMQTSEFTGSEKDKNKWEGQRGTS